MIHKRVRHPARANIACLQWILTVFPDLDEIPQLPPAPLLRAEIAGSRICWEQKLLSPALAPAELDSSFCWESVKANAMAVKTAGMHSSSPRPLLSDRSECCSLPTLSPGWVGSSLHVVVSRATLSWCPHSDMHQTKYQTHEIQSAKKKKKKSVRDSAVLSGRCEIWYPYKNTLQKAEGKAGPGTAAGWWQPECHILPSTAWVQLSVTHQDRLWQPLAPPGLGTEQGEGSPSRKTALPFSWL